jgi:hypothetical protein
MQAEFQAKLVDFIRHHSLIVPPLPEAHSFTPDSEGRFLTAEGRLKRIAYSITVPIRTPPNRRYGRATMVLLIVESALRRACGGTSSHTIFGSWREGGRTDRDISVVVGATGDSGDWREHVSGMRHCVRTVQEKLQQREVYFGVDGITATYDGYSEEQRLALPEALDFGATETEAMHMFELATIQSYAIDIIFSPNSFAAGDDILQLLNDAAPRLKSLQTSGVTVDGVLRIDGLPERVTYQRICAGSEYDALPLDAIVVRVFCRAPIGKSRRLSESVIRCFGSNAVREQTLVCAYSARTSTHTVYARA